MIFARQIPNLNPFHPPSRAEAPRRQLFVTSSCNTRHMYIRNDGGKTAALLHTYAQHTHTYIHADTRMSQWREEIAYRFPRLPRTEGIFRNFAERIVYRQLIQITVNRTISARAKA